MNTYRNLALLLFLLLLGAGVFIYMQVQSAKVEKYKRMSDHLQTQNLVDGYKAEIKQKQGSIDTLQARVIKDGLKFKASETGLKIAIQQRDKRIVQLKAVLAPVIQDNPELSELISEQDIKIGLLDSLVDTQALYCQSQITDLSQIISLQKSQIQDALQIGELEKQRGDKLEKDVKKAGKAKRFFGGLAGILGAVLIVELIAK